MNAFGGAYRDRRVLVTGHTGFKGSWLALWLARLGARVTGMALPAASPSHWQTLDLPIAERTGDLRDFAVAAAGIAETAPDIVFHLAAQSLVRASYADPLATWSTNVMATANVLEACRHTSSVRAVVVVTTDKCYENREWVWGYRELDRLGGHDPYSASKAAAELVTASYRSAFYAEAKGPLVATARAGNVIGGGDWAADRLVPDFARARTAGLPLLVRQPDATRPWQHVLDCLSGYLVLGARLMHGDRACADAWNFGPSPEDNWTVRRLLDELQAQWPGHAWLAAEGPRRHESNLLYLDASKARMRLGWRPTWTLDEAVAATAQWYRTFLDEARGRSDEQLDRYVAAARCTGAEWSIA